MRKLKLQVQISIDSFICGPKGEMDWLRQEWSQDIKEYVDEITRPVDLILLGRNLAAGFIPHWASVAGDPANPEREAGVKYTETPKIVFTKTLTESPWKNTLIENGDYVKKVKELKLQEGQDIIAYGGSQFVSSLLKAGLVDELNLFVNPVVIGKGMPIFQEVQEHQRFDPIEARHFACGIVLLKYQLKT